MNHTVAQCVIEYLDSTDLLNFCQALGLMFRSSNETFWLSHCVSYFGTHLIFLKHRSLVQFTTQNGYYWQPKNNHQLFRFLDHITTQCPESIFMHNRTYTIVEMLANDRNIDLDVLLAWKEEENLIRPKPGDRGQRDLIKRFSNLIYKNQYIYNSYVDALVITYGSEH